MPEESMLCEAKERDNMDTPLIEDGYFAAPEELAAVYEGAALLHPYEIAALLGVSPGNLWQQLESDTCHQNRAIKTIKTTQMVPNGTVASLSNGVSIRMEQCWKEQLPANQSLVRQIPGRGSTFTDGSQWDVGFVDDVQIFVPAFVSESSLKSQSHRFKKYQEISRVYCKRNVKLKVFDTKPTSPVVQTRQEKDEDLSLERQIDDSFDCSRPAKSNIEYEEIIRELKNENADLRLQLAAVKSKVFDSPGIQSGYRDMKKPRLISHHRYGIPGHKLPARPPLQMPTVDLPSSPFAFVLESSATEQPCPWHD